MDGWRADCFLKESTMPGEPEALPLSGAAAAAAAYSLLFLAHTRSFLFFRRANLTRRSKESWEKGELLEGRRARAERDRDRDRERERERERESKRTFAARSSQPVGGWLAGWCQRERERDTEPRARAASTPNRSTR